MTQPRVLVVTNDFPPTLGGIQTYIRDYLQALTAPRGDQPAHLPASHLHVFASTQDISAAAEYDKTVGYAVTRWRRKIMLPTPAVAKEMTTIIRREQIDTVWFAAAAPLAVLAPAARRAGARRIVASTHGHEVGWSMFPGSRQVLRHIGKHVDCLTYVSRYVRNRIAGTFGPAVAWEPLPGGVDSQRFAPQPAETRDALRARYGLETRKIIVAVSRIVPRKGQDTLVEALPHILREEADAHLVIVGPGDYRKHLERRAAQLGVSSHLTCTGPVPATELAAHYALGDVFALPVRTRAGGLSVEGLGIVFLESQATQVATVAGDGGGAPETVVDGVSGCVVPARNVREVARTLSGLLRDEQRRTELAVAGRAHVQRNWSWDALAAQASRVLAGEQPGSRETPPPSPLRGVSSAQAEGSRLTQDQGQQQNQSQKKQEQQPKHSHHNQRGTA